MPTTKQKKGEILEDLRDCFKKAKSIVFTNYSGLNVKNITALRSKLRKNNVDLKVAKKTLMKIAAKDAGLPEIPNELISGPVSAAFSFGDEIVAAKTLYTFAKEHEALKLLGGIMEGKILSREKTIELAKLPTREELIAKFMGSIQSPVYGFYGILSGILRGFMYALNGLREQKGKTA